MVSLCLSDDLLQMVRDYLFGVILGWFENPVVPLQSTLYSGSLVWRQAGRNGPESCGRQGAIAISRGGDMEFLHWGGSRRNGKRFILRADLMEYGT